MLREETARSASDVDFDGFYREQYGRLVRALLLLTGEPSEAEDLAQEALSRVFERWERVRTMDSPEGYLYRTALNLNRKRLRRLAVRTRRAITMRSPERDLSTIDDRLAVLAAVATLPRAQREALVLVEWLGLETKEAAEILGIAPASVRSRLMDARRNLRERLGGSDG
jgi:RNA polymerase sigma-70 factor (ECF subfamily)